MIFSPKFADENNPVPSADSPASSNAGRGKMTTWSNLGSRQKSESYCTSSQQQQQPQQQEPDRYSRARRREENSINNNNGSGSGSGSGEGSSRKSKSLPDMARDSNRRMEDISGGGDGSKLVSAFIRNKKGERLSWNEDQAAAAAAAAAEEDGGGGGPIPMMRSKDTVNQYLKSAGAVAAPSARLTSIQEDAAAATPSSSENSSRESTLRSETAAAAPTAAAGEAAASTPSKSSSSSSKKYPDLNFLEDDVGLWDAFFLHSRNASKFHSVLGKQESQQRRQRQHQQPPPPPLPVEEYLQRQQRPQSAYSIQDLESLRTLLPQPHKGLLPPPTPSSEQKPPLAQVCQSLSRLHVHQQQQQGGSCSSNSHDAQNEVIKNMFNQQQQQQQSDPVQVVKVKEAWAPTEERKEAVVVRRRKKKQQVEVEEEEDLNLINNNCAEDLAAKRRSFHPTDHLSRAFEQPQLSRRSSAVARRARRADFPKVIRSNLDFFCEYRFCNDSQFNTHISVFDDKSRIFFCDASPQHDRKKNRDSTVLLTADHISLLYAEHTHTHLINAVLYIRKCHCKRDFIANLSIL